MNFNRLARNAFVAGTLATGSGNAIAEAPQRPKPVAVPTAEQGFREKRVEGIAIRGDRAFLERTEEALRLLQASPSFRVVRPFLRRIVQSERSGMEANAVEPTYHVGRATSDYSPTWYASTIAHDTFHSALYRRSQEYQRHQAVPDAVWTGAQAERLCLRFQLRVAQELGADETILQYLRGLEQDPTYQGDGSQEAYRQRNW